ncbi:MAG TPA: YcgL domain-containing protein [Marinobacter sp.]|nr:YcgL domain-containing protein [Marinobacter sp.]
MKEREFVSVFRSTKRSDTYIYVRRGQKWDDLPENLRIIFGQPVHAMDLIVTAGRKLARTSGKQVLEALEEKGFLLQMPEEQAGYVVEFRKTLERRDK